MKIAVVGGSISGLVAARELSRQQDVRLFGASSHLGGHMYTVPVEEDGRTSCCRQPFPLGQLM